MHDLAEVLDRGIPDLVDSTTLPAALAAEVDFLAGRTGRWSEDPSAPAAYRARALAAGGQPDRAREALGECGGSTLDAHELSAACWAVSRVGGNGLVGRLQDAVADLEPGFVFEGTLPITNTAMLEGLLAVVRGDLASATEKMEAAVRVGDERAPVWGALARIELARVLKTRAQSDSDPGATAQRAGQAIAAARAFFLAGAYGHLAEVAKGLEQPPLMVDIAEPMLGHLVRGESWVVGFGVQPPVALDDRLGLRTIEYLILNRDRRVPAVELEAALEGRVPQWWDQIDEQLLRSEILLENADLPEPLRDLLIDDRARSRTSKLIRRTLVAIAEVHPVLGAHLEHTVSTGHGCRYECDPAVRWRLSGA